MKKISNKEFIWYLGCGFVAAVGLVFVIFGIIGDHMAGLQKYNFVLNAQEKFFMDFRYFGLILIGVGVIVALCVLLYYAKRVDRDVEKRIRREQRISAQSSTNIEVKKAVEVIEESSK